MGALLSVLGRRGKGVGGAGGAGQRHQLLEGAPMVARTLEGAELFDQIADAVSGGQSGPA